MKQILFILLSMVITNAAWAQGVTKNGKVTTTGSEYVDKNGKVGGSFGVDKNGKVVAAVTPLAVGDPHQGGIIAYLFVVGDLGYVAGEVHGLIAAASDQATGTATYGCYSSKAPSLGATGTAIGTGKTNTENIVANCPDTGIAAKLCTALTLGGYTDWYLPSKDELHKLYINQAAIGGFIDHKEYLSSSEYTSMYFANIWTQVFGPNDIQPTPSKSNITFYVRAVRTF